jgi:hypothetical protein
MNRWLAALGAVVLVAIIFTGCSRKTAPVAMKDGSTASGQKAKHFAAHDGSLNAIVTCENGHAEVKLDGDKLQLWFVGGGVNTDKSVRVPDKSIRIQVTTDSGAKTLVLNPKPLDLAGEKVGDCSYFESTAPWLKGLAKFTADGQVTFSGKKMPLKIEYPKGYDPD